MTPTAITTPDEALARVQDLSKKLDARATDIELFERYYEGQHRLRFATRKFREAFGALFREFSSNWMGVVVDSTTERLRIEGFRIPTPKKEKEREEAQKKREDEAREFQEQKIEAARDVAVAEASAKVGSATVGGAPTTPGAPPPAIPGLAELDTGPVRAGVPSVIGDDSTGDTEAWDMWQRNKLDLYSDVAHETALITGYAYILIGPQDDGSTEHPIITVEHPLEMVTQHAAGNVKQVTAALKRWWDQETGHAYATLYMPDSIWKFQSASEYKKTPASKALRWVPREGVPNRIENTMGVVPVVPLVNRQKLTGHGRSEIADVIPIQDAINKLTNDLLVASEFAAFRQRILTGMEIPEDENGNIIPDFDLKAAVNRLMIVKDENVKVHEFGITDLSQYVNGIVHLRDSLAAITRTPPQYLIGQVVNVSGEALKAAESGHVQKAKRKTRFFGESWEEAIRLAFLLKGDTERAESYAAETIWANPEVMTESALADSLAKYAILSVPMVALWERMGASQTEIQRWLQLLETQPEPIEGVAAALGSMVRAGQLEG